MGSNDTVADADGKSNAPPSAAENSRLGQRGFSMSGASFGDFSGFGQDDFNLGRNGSGGSKGEGRDSCSVSQTSRVCVLLDSRLKWGRRG